MDKGERIYNELLHEIAGIWYISDHYGSKILIKLPSTSIKALIKGCKMELLFGKDETVTPHVIHKGVKIYDDPVNYQILSSTQRFQDEHFSLAKIMHLQSVQIHLHNELNVCQAYCTLVLSELNKHNVHAFIGNPKNLYNGDFDELISHSLDNFQFTLGFEYNYPRKPVAINTLTIESKIEKWNFIVNSFFNPVKTEISIEDSDEGSILEKEILVIFRSIFNTDVYKSPQIPNKGSFRELTDILAFSEFANFLVESKALSITKANEKRTMERKVAGLQKQVEKAIQQLLGAAKRIAENTPVYNSKGDLLSFNRKLLPHGIILVSELFPFGNWDETIFAMLKTMREFNIWLHLMDMKEFMQYVGHSKGNRDRFDYLLSERIKSFVANPRIIEKTTFTQEPSEN